MLSLLGWAPPPQPRTRSLPQPPQPTSQERPQARSAEGRPAPALRSFPSAVGSCWAEAAAGSRKEIKTALRHESLPAHLCCPFTLRACVPSSVLPGAPRVLGTLWERRVRVLRASLARRGDGARGLGRGARAMGWGRAWLGSLGTPVWMQRAPSGPLGSVGLGFLGWDSRWQCHPTELAGAWDATVGEKGWQRPPKSPVLAPCPRFPGRRVGGPSGSCSFCRRTGEEEAAGQRTRARRYGEWRGGARSPQPPCSAPRHTPCHVGRPASEQPECVARALLPAGTAEAQCPGGLSPQAGVEAGQLPGRRFIQPGAWKKSWGGPGLPW